VQQLQKHLKAVVLTGANDVGIHGNVLHVDEFVANHVIAALTV
jgi:hypothetical protein